MMESIFTVWCTFVIVVAISYAFEDGTHKERFKAAIATTLKFMVWLAVVMLAIIAPLAIFGNC